MDTTTGTLLIVGAAAFVLGVTLGIKSHKTKRKQGLMCQCDCGHSLAKHDPETNECHAQIPRHRFLDTTRWVTCDCRQYVGPKPIPLDFNQPYTFPAESDQK